MIQTAGKQDLTFNMVALSDWWPRKLGGTISYTFFWTVSLFIGFIAHHLNLFAIGKRRPPRDGADDVDWERKSE